MTMILSDRTTWSNAVKRITLGNGLRVLLAEVGYAPVAAVCLHYDVGFRSEPEKRSGFAHLFEHLMFQGAEGLPASNHLSVVQACGGSGNGSTHPDFTEYYDFVPASGLERVLFLEAARMRAPRLTAEALRVQTAVVKEEIAAQVTSRPYGGFPWTVLPSALYDNYANAHNGYGDVEHLDAATLDESVDFFDKYYAPANAVLTVVGAFDLAETLRWIEAYFGSIPARLAPPPASHEEDPTGRERRERLVHKAAPNPAIALGFRLPDVRREAGRYAAAVALADVLAGGTASVLVNDLVDDRRLAHRIRAKCGFFAPFETRDPDTMSVVAVHGRETPADEIIGTTYSALDTIARHGPDPDLLRSVVARLRLRQWRLNESLLMRAGHMGAYELLFDRPELIDDIPALLGSVTPEQIADVAGSLLNGPRGIVTLTPEETA